MLEAKNKIGKRSQIYAFAMQNVTNIRGYGVFSPGFNLVRLRFF